MDGRPSRTNKAAFSNSSCVAWMRPQSLLIKTKLVLILVLALVSQFLYGCFCVTYGVTVHFF